MANINDPIPPEDENLRGRRLGYRRNAGWGWGGLWVWLWIWILIIIFFGWFGGWGYGGYGGWWGWGGRRAVVVQPIQLQNSTLATLTAPDKSSYIGKQVTLSQVQIQGSAGDSAWWVGPSNMQELLVVTPQNVHPTKSGGAQTTLNNGDLVNITGTVKQAPPTQQAQQHWGLSSDDATRLDNQGVYVEASNLTQNQQ
ncbi:MAG: hypothetical protein ABI383_05255 [Acidobacteriaceae bacterium]